MPNAHPARLTFFIPAMIAVLLLAAYAGTRGLTFDSIWYDEWRSLVYIGKTTINDGANIPGTPGRVIAESDALNPPAYYVLLSVWGTVAGTDTPVLRYFSVLLGVLTTAVVYRVGAEVQSREVGLAAAAIFGTMAMTSVFFHEMRTYSLAMLVVMLHLWLYWRCLRDDARWWHYAAFTGVIGLALHTHYTAVLMMGGTFVYHVVFVRRKWFMVGLYFAAVLLVVPWALVVLSAGAVENVQDRANTAMPVTQILTTLLQMVGNDSRYFWLVGVPLLLALGRGRLLWVHVLVGITAYLTLNALVPFACCRRYMLVMLPGFALLAAVGITRYRWLAIGFVALWIGSGFYTSRDLTYAHNVTNTPRWHYPWADIRAGVPALDENDRVLALLPGGINVWTHEGLAEHFFPGGEADVLATFRAIPREDSLNELLLKTVGSEHLYVAYKKSWPAYHLVDMQELLSLAFVSCGTVLETADAHLLLYVSTQQTCPPA